MIIYLLYITQSYIIHGMEELNKIIGNNLLCLRKKFNYKQSEVAEKLNYSDKTISKWETGEVVPSVENLVELCKLYNVSLDEITSKDFQSKKLDNFTKNSSTNKLIISLLAISAVWILATVIFVYANLISNSVIWQVFVWAVPASMVLSIIFNTLWGKPKANYIYISILIWSLLACFYLQFLQYNLIPLFFIGVPCQVAILLWSGIKKKR